MTQVGLGHGMVRSLQIRHPFNIFAMAEVAMDVPNKGYYIEKLQMLVLKQFIYKCYRLTHRKQQTLELNLVAEHFGVVTMCSTTKFTVPIFAVFHVRVNNTCI